MTWTVLSHTADVALEIHGETPAELYVEALRALTATITDLDTVRSLVRREVTVKAADAELLLVELLQGALELFDVERLLVVGARVKLSSMPDGMALTATLAGETFDAARHPLQVAVKAVTYHDLRIWEGAGGWHARVVFDI